MRRLWYLLLALILLCQAVPIPVAADYIVGSQTYGDVDFDLYEHDAPVEVVVRERSNRYALDVVYDTLSIDVESAIWDVNDHVYAVQMSEDLTFNVTLINHSDLPVYVKVTPISNVPGISFLQDPIFSNRVTVPAAVPILPIGDTTTYAVPLDASAAGYITSAITAYSENWQGVVNQIIMSEQIRNGVYTVGTLRIEFFRE